MNLRALADGALGSKAVAVPSSLRRSSSMVLDLVITGSRPATHYSRQSTWL